METRVCRLYGAGDLRVEQEIIGTPKSGEVVVRIGHGGICGSDLHYYKAGGVGQIRVREPMILGHEIAGIIEKTGPEVTSLKSGDRVAVNPSRPCGTCKFCTTGLRQHCLNMRFLGSAMYLPHEQGGFRDRMIVPEEQCIPAHFGTSLAALACSEPLAVCLHAANRAGSLKGKKVLISGTGPIGALCTAVVKKKEAAEIVAVDIENFPLDVARQMGASRTINVAENPDSMKHYFEDKGYFDLVLECSAAEKAIESGLQAVKPQGTVIQVGVVSSLPFPVGMFVSKEIQWYGSMRFNLEFDEATALIDNGEINVAPIVTDTFPLTDIKEAFQASSDRSASIKVQLTFDK